MPLTTTFNSPDPEAMRHLTEGLPTKSAKIRVLWAEGYRRADIAAFLGIRYQHVRNVLLHPRKDAGGTPTAPGATREVTVSASGRAHLVEGGRIALPDAALARLGVSAGDVVPWRAGGDGEVILMSPAAGIRVIREIAKRHPLPPGVLATDLLFEERRRDAEQDDQES